MNKKNIILGILDLHKSKSPLGDFLVLLQELNCVCDDGKATYIEIAIIGNSVNAWLPVTISGMHRVRKTHLFNDEYALNAWLRTIDYVANIWPLLDRLHEYRYGSMIFIRDFLFNNRKPSGLMCTADFYQAALDFLAQHAKGKLPVTLHLKNHIRQSGKPDWFNARLDQWIPFLQRATLNQDFVFILIGNDPLPAEVRQIQNVLVTQDYPLSLIQDLALIECSFAFLGVASGPSQMAILSTIPYIIYKNPDHHIELMIEELGNEDHFSFSHSGQRFFRKFETYDDIESSFAELLSMNTKVDWERRLSELKKSYITDAYRISSL